jgi:hypothetical protein
MALYIAADGLFLPPCPCHCRQGALWHAALHVSEQLLWHCTVRGTLLNACSSAFISGQNQAATEARLQAQEEQLKALKRQLEELQSGGCQQLRSCYSCFRGELTPQHCLGDVGRVLICLYQAFVSIRLSLVHACILVVAEAIEAYPELWGIEGIDATSTACTTCFRCIFHESLLTSSLWLGCLPTICR